MRDRENQDLRNDQRQNPQCNPCNEEFQDDNCSANMEVAEEIEVNRGQQDRDRRNQRRNQNRNR